MDLETGMDMYTLPCVKQLVETYCTVPGAQSSTLWLLEGWDGGGGEMGRVGWRSKREGMHVYLWMIHFVVEQKLTAL